MVVELLISALEISQTWCRWWKLIDSDKLRYRYLGQHLLPFCCLNVDQIFNKNPQMKVKSQTDNLPKYEFASICGSIWSTFRQHLGNKCWPSKCFEICLHRNNCVIFYHLLSRCKRKEAFLAFKMGRRKNLPLFWYGKYIEAWIEMSRQVCHTWV